MGERNTMNCDIMLEGKLRLSPKGKTEAYGLMRWLEDQAAAVVEAVAVDVPEGDLEAFERASEDKAGAPDGTGFANDCHNGGAKAKEEAAPKGKEEAAPKGKEEAAPKVESGTPDRAALVKEAEALGIEVKKGVRATTIAKLIANHKASAPASKEEEAPASKEEEAPAAEEKTEADSLTYEDLHKRLSVYIAVMGEDSLKAMFDGLGITSLKTAPESIYPEIMAAADREQEAAGLL